MKIRFFTKGDYRQTERFLQKAKKIDYSSILNAYGAQGVAILAGSTPKDTGETASAWSYTVEALSDGYRISWSNSVKAGGTPLAILLQYGHGTGWGGYVEGRDYINPAMKAIFDGLAESLWKEVTKL